MEKDEFHEERKDFFLSWTREWTWLKHEAGGKMEPPHVMWVYPLMISVKILIVYRQHLSSLQTPGHHWQLFLLFFSLSLSLLPLPCFQHCPHGASRELYSQSWTWFLVLSLTHSFLLKLKSTPASGYDEATGTRLVFQLHTTRKLDKVPHSLPRIFHLWNGYDYTRQSCLWKIPRTSGEEFWLCRHYTHTQYQISLQAEWGHQNFIKII